MAWLGRAWWAALAVIFGVVVLQAVLLGGREYRLDEIWRLHAAIGRGPVETMGYIYQDVNPPLYPVLASLWLPLTGHSEAATHHISALILLVTLALYARFVTDTFDTQTATLAVTLLGLLPVFFFYTHDAGPYTLYMLAWTGTTFTFARWLHTRRLRYALLYVIFGVIGVYTQFMTVFVIVTQIVFLLVAVRFHWGRVLFGVGMAAAVALALLGGWGLILLQRALSSQDNTLLFAYFTTYSLDAVRVVVNGMDVWPLLGIALAGALVHLPAREAPLLRLRYARLPSVLGLLGLGLFAVLFALNTSGTRLLTPRNLLIFLPLIALLAALAARHLGRPIAIATLVLSLLNLLWYPLWTFGDYFAARDVGAAVDTVIEPGAAVVVIQNTMTEFAFIPVNYYLSERVQPRPEAITLIAPPPVDNNAVRNVPFPHEPDVRFFAEDTAAARERLTNTLALYETLWTVTLQPNALGDALPNALANTHAPTQTITVPAPRSLVPAGEVLLQGYRRLPDDLNTRYRFGNALTLDGWQVEPLTAPPCAAVTIRTFWRTDAPLDANYSLNLSAVAEVGNVLTTQDTALTNVLTGLWQPGRVYPDTRTLTVPCDAAPSTYALVGTVYNPETVERLPITTADGEPVPAVAFLTTLTVE
jgi:uncharacterized membrane protein